MKNTPNKTATPSVEFDTAKLIDLQKQYVDDATKLWQQAWGNVASPSSSNVQASDRRFAADA